MKRLISYRGPERAGGICIDKEFIGNQCCYFCPIRDQFIIAIRPKNQHYQVIET